MESSLNIRNHYTMGFVSSILVNWILLISNTFFLIVNALQLRTAIAIRDCDPRPAIGLFKRLSYLKRSLKLITRPFLVSVPRAARPAK